jgi:hypothetical protein
MVGYEKVQSMEPKKRCCKRDRLSRNWVILKCPLAILRTHKLGTLEDLITYI